MSADENFEMFGFDDISVDDLEVLLPSEGNNHRWPDMMLTVHESLRSELAKIGLDERYALVLLARLCEDTGGLQYYFPKGDLLENQLKRMHIWKEFNGNNVPELAKKYDLSTQNVYVAIRHMRSLEMAKRQPKLF
ncbi:positive regulator of late transcription [Vibrio sp. DW001]|uniref:Mor transcription activator family protein n=1 Tax=Vibrio sp. DW001 TaxID=2912315 RepID=UPI0023AEB7B3|nr:Mor transcription activator family protein [Vibrio sp. DW001]WED29183.1 positive regulator of late transcription [Vibrio sp. DW001]